ncbi:MAG: hypothetical protein MUF14_09370, partial [Hyphomonadaceae bacterium]|nr:hypothetical protein [Hyphomonadaceae bacterium]
MSWTTGARRSKAARLRGNRPLEPDLAGGTDLFPLRIVPLRAPDGLRAAPLWRTALVWLALALVLMALAIASLTVMAFNAYKLDSPYDGETLPSFEVTRCGGFDLPEGRPVECGRLSVAQTRTAEGKPAPGTKVVTIPVAILKATDPSPQPDPVVFLDGGPGYGTLENLAQTFTGTDWPEVKPGEPPLT